MSKFSSGLSQLVAKQLLFLIVITFHFQEIFKCGCRQSRPSGLLLNLFSVVNVLCSTCNTEDFADFSFCIISDGHIYVTIFTAQIFKFRFNFLTRCQRNLIQTPFFIKWFLIGRFGLVFRWKKFNNKKQKKEVKRMTSAFL